MYRGVRPPPRHRRPSRMGRGGVEYPPDHRGFGKPRPADRPTYLVGPPGRRCRQPAVVGPLGPRPPQPRGSAPASAESGTGQRPPATGSPRHPGVAPQPEGSGCRCSHGDGCQGSSESPHVVGLAGFEPATSPLSEVRSNQLSYSPVPNRTVSGFSFLPLAAPDAHRSGPRSDRRLRRRQLVTAVGARLSLPRPW